jgi:hypothetical protein
MNAKRLQGVSLQARVYRGRAEAVVRLGGCQMALSIENVVDGGMGGEKELGRSLALEALHLAFSSSGRLMRILRARRRYTIASRR